MVAGPEAPTLHSVAEVDAEADGRVQADARCSTGKNARSDGAPNCQAKPLFKTGVITE